MGSSDDERGVGYGIVMSTKIYPLLQFFANEVLVFQKYIFKAAPTQQFSRIQARRNGKKQNHSGLWK